MSDYIHPALAIPLVLVLWTAVVYLVARKLIGYWPEKDYDEFEESSCHISDNEGY